MPRTFHTQSPAATPCLRYVIASQVLALCAVLFAALPASADDPSKALLGRAQQRLDGRAVEDLISKLEGGKAKPAPPAAAAPADPMASTTAGQPVGRPSTAPPSSEQSTQVASPSPPPVSTTTPEGETAPPAAPASAAAGMPPIAVPPQTTSAAIMTQPPPGSSNPEPAPAASPPQPDRPTASEPAAPSAPPPVPVVVPAAPPQPPQSSPEAAVAGADRQLLPSVDLEVTFPFDSAEVGPAAVPTLALLGRAISDPRLASATFLIAGHTDAKGRADYNLRLSQLRADAVRAFLIVHYGIDPRRLTAKGFGESRLKISRSPLADANRRVQVINTTKLAKH